MSGYVVHGFGDLADPPPPSLTEFLAGLNDAPWVRDALCAQVDTEMWFPSKRGHDDDGSSETELIRQARAVCGRCPVRAECLQYAVDNDEAHGIWGGTVPGERRRMKAGASTPRPCQRDGCTETIPGWEHESKRYHTRACARIANEDRIIAGLDTGPIVAAYVEEELPIGAIAKRHQLQVSLVSRILDRYGVDHTRSVARARAIARRRVQEAS